MKLKNYRIQIKNQLYEVHGIIKCNSIPYFLVDTNVPIIDGIVYYSDTIIYKSILYKTKDAYGCIKINSMYMTITTTLRNELNKFMRNEIKK